MSAGDARDKEIEDRFRGALDLLVGDTPSAANARRCSCGKSVNQCAARDLNGFEVGRAELAACERIGQHALRHQNQFGIVAGQCSRVVVVEISAQVSEPAIGPRAWRILHLAGGYYLWFRFMVSFGKRIPTMPLYSLFLVPLLVVMALRLIAMARAGRAIGAA